jgi:DNA repair protein RecN (Recombination protein N)
VVLSREKKQVLGSAKLLKALCALSVSADNLLFQGSGTGAMLLHLSIRDIVLIDTLDLHFTDGLSVLTGETGAGKSILLDALGLCLGARGDGSLVRHGQVQGQVIASFDLPLNHPARLAALEIGLETEGDFIVRRIQMADGRSRAFINDQATSIQVLKTIGNLLVEIHGQHDDRAFADPATHRIILDSYGNLGQNVAEVATAYKNLRMLQNALQQKRLLIEKARKEADFLRYAVEELTSLAPQPDEERILSDQRQTMMQAEKIAQDLHDALELFEGRSSVIPALSSAMRKLERRSTQVPALVSSSVQALETALIALDLARDALGEAMRATSFEPRDLENSEERLFALRAASRKYNVSVDDLATLRVNYVHQVEALDEGEEKLSALEADAKIAEAVYREAAQRLSERRYEAASILSDAIAEELPPLKLERARFLIEIQTEDHATELYGFDRVEFWAQTNPGTKPGPLLKIASGGELSRFMLALKVVLADKGSAPTLIFDEIDTGVGGAVADAIGDRLARLSKQVQVVAVTHAPQVAAKAQTHFLISKEGFDNARVVTRIRILQEDDRREEIARMLAGAIITNEARAAAARLIAEIK